MKRIIGAVAACAALAACGGPDPAPPTAAPKAEPSVSVAVTDCGTFDLPQGDRLPGSAAQCLIEAVRAGQPARLKVTSLTVEGAPIPVTYTAGADGRVEVIRDSRKDTFGSQTITRQTCTEPVGGVDLEFAECSEATPATK